MSRKKALMFALIFSASLAFKGGIAAADYTKRVCFGSDQANGCPVSADIMRGCTDDEETAAVVAACTIVSNGTKKVMDGHADRQGTHSGGACGYTWYSVTCFNK
ncbi:hypothetical protein NKJ90_19535 [Mesorhizobium sp. M0051]|uniref:hypothetical protein n=1 Tax=Mesorhizobium sp. M0051 TaxID=2956862 RepID=UPI0033397A9C